jgi:hypothetical protein
VSNPPTLSPGAPRAHAPFPKKIQNHAFKKKKKILRLLKTTQTRSIFVQIGPFLRHSYPKKCHSFQKLHLKSVKSTHTLARRTSRSCTIPQKNSKSCIQKKKKSKNYQNCPNSLNFRPNRSIFRPLPPKKCQSFQKIYHKSVKSTHTLARRTSRSCTSTRCLAKSVTSLASAVKRAFKAAVDRAWPDRVR